MKKNEIVQVATPQTLLEKVSKALKLDGWSNVLTAVGIKGKDKRMSATVMWERGTRDNFDHLYSADDVAGNIVDIVPEEAFTKGYKLKGIEDVKVMDKVIERARALKVDTRFIEAWKLARMQGGAGVLKVTEDAKMEFPIPQAKPYLSLSVLDRWELVVNSTDIDQQITSATYREPLRYNLQLSEGSNSKFQVIDRSRVIRFEGAFLPRRIFIQNGYWGDSVLTKIENAIRNYQISHDALAVTVQDFDVPVLKLKDLAELMTQNCDEEVIKRLEMINLSKSIAKMIVLDSENEDFEHKSRNVTGLDDIMNKVESRLVTAARMPRTKLFGESAGGLGSTGESQQTDWHKFIESQQENYLKPKLLEFYRHLVRTEFVGIDPMGLDIEFNPLWQMSEKEEADVRKTQAETDQIYITNQVVDSTEIALSRFGGDKYSSDTTIDKTLREQKPITPADVEAIKPPAGSAEVPAAGNESLEKTEQVKQAALNGAQVTSLQDLVIKVQSGELPLDTGKELAKIGFGLTPEQITELFAAVKPGSQKPEAPAVKRFNVKKDAAFEHEFDVFTKSGQPLKIKGYKFEGIFKKDGEKVGTFDVIKVQDGKIRVKLDSLPVAECDAIIEMTSPLGFSKVIKSIKATLND